MPSDGLLLGGLKSLFFEVVVHLTPYNLETVRAIWNLIDECMQGFS